MQLRDFAQRLQVPPRRPGVKLSANLRTSGQRRAGDLRQLDQRVREDARERAEDFCLRERRP